VTARPEKDAPGVIAPPPVIYAGFLVLGIGLEWVWPSGVFPGALRYGIGLPAIAISFVLAGWAILQFGRIGTHLDVRKPAKALATSGPYRFSRNPMYLALTVLYLGIGVTADSVWVLLLCIPTLGVMQLGVIRREERYLERKFGQAYLNYRRAVRRWV